MQCFEHGPTNELDFNIWNANWPVKCEAEMAAHVGQFCTSVLVPYAASYVSLSLRRGFLHLPEGLLVENTHKISLEKTRVSLKTSNIFRQNKTKWHVILFTKINYQIYEKPGKTVSINYFRELPSTRPLFIVSLSCLDNSAHFLGPRTF